MGTLYADGKIGLPLTRLSGEGSGGRIFCGLGEKTGVVCFVSDAPRGGYEDEKKRGKWGIYSPKTGKVIVKPAYDGIRTIDRTFIQTYLVKKGDKWGVIDEKGKVLEKPIYDDVKVFGTVENFKKVCRAFVKKRDKWAEIDRLGKVGNFEYDHIGFVWNDVRNDRYTYDSDLFMVIGQNGKTAMYDTGGQKLFEVEGEDILSKFEDYAVLRRGGKLGVINKKNEVLVPFAYDKIDFRVLEEDDVQKVAFVVGKGSEESGYLYGAVNEAGEEKLPVEYEKISAGSEGFMSVKKEGKFGFINGKLELAIPIQFDEVESFFWGKARVKKDGVEGKIDKKGVFTPLD